jgi:hypothetical protein
MAAPLMLFVCLFEQPSKVGFLRKGQDAAPAYSAARAIDLD